MLPEAGNLYAQLPAPEGGEAGETLFRHGGARVERIASHRHASPPGFWYDQPEAEWVVVLQGGATLGFADGRQVDLAAGDWITIPPRVPHRIERTDPATLWLAVHVAAPR